ncbi:MAG: APC family permease [Nitrospirota bacterium]
MSIKRFLIGQPIETVKEKRERLTKVMGLAIFSSDNLSSVAYATEEILLALILAGTALLHLSLPVAAGIALVIAIVSTSYYQIIHAYPSGGGAYIVAKENLGIYPGLIAGASLFIDYVLTAAVSITAGIAAITSAFPMLYEHRVALCLAAILLLMIANLRGVKESGKTFSVPAYLFIGSIFLLIGAGIIKYLYMSHPYTPEYRETSTNILPIFIVLRAFASGCVAATGIEAVADGVQAFKPPEAKNAGITLIWMALILSSFFIGISFLASHLGILPKEDETVLSQVARAVFSEGPFYYTVQLSTSLILILAANTSFAGFPRLASVMAKDKYMPRQLSNLGDRLVYSNGIIILGFFAALLIILFGGYTHALIPLYALGVFLSFTLSQAGMVKHWINRKGKGWIKGISINGIGTVTTAIVLVVIASTKFLQGAWIVIIAIPGLVYLIKNIHKHYELAAEQLSLDGTIPKDFKHHSVIVPVSGVHKATLGALKYARSLSDDVVAVYVCLDPGETEKIKSRWGEYGMGVPLIVLESPYRSITEPLIDYIDETRKRYKDGVITVILPEFVPSKWWHHLLHNQTALLIKGLLLFKKGVVSTSVPFHFRR